MVKDRSFSVPIALLAAGALFLEILDGTILTTAVPAIARDFGVQATDISMALVAYLAAAAAGIPAAGWLADRYGVRTVLLLALVLFIGASLACALAPNLTVLIGARVVQGLGGALIVPVGRLAVIRGIKPEDLLDAIAFLTWPALIAPVIAPALGGLLADTVGWRWIFLLNVPLGLIAVVAGWFILPKATAQPTRKFDGVGFMGAVIVLVSLTVAAELITRDSSKAYVWAFCFLICSAVCLGFLARWLSAPAKLFDLSVLSIPSFRVANASGSVYRLIITAAPFMFTLLFQVYFGWSATTAGLMVMALFVGNVAIKPFSTRIIRGLGFRRVLVVSNVLGALVLATFVLVSATTPTWFILVLLLFSGALRSLGFSAYNTLQFTEITPEQTGNANVLSATLHQLGMSLGIGVAVICMSFAPSPAWAFPLAALLFIIPLAGALILTQDAGGRALKPQ